MPNSDHLHALIDGPESWKQLRQKVSSLDLGGADLDGANLREVNLAGVNLGGAHLARANLSMANLAGANLGGADLVGANLGGASLFEASLVRANMFEARAFGANLSGADLSGTNLSGAELYRVNFDKVKWDPVRPPRWSEGFDPPENSWHRGQSSTDALPVLSKLRPVRVDQFATADLPALLQGLEPFLTEVRRRLDDHEFSEVDVLRVELALNGLEAELWRNPDAPSPAVVTGHQSRLFQVVGAGLPTDTGVSLAATEAASKAIAHAANLDTSASDESMTEATAVVEALADTVDALMGDVPRDVDGMFPGNLPRHDRAWRLLYESLGWSVPHAASALGGAAVAHQLITGMFTAFPPFWAAALGAVLGLLGNAFRPSSQVDRDQQSLG